MRRLFKYPDPLKIKRMDVTRTCIRLKRYFGMKAHICVDAKSGLTHTLVTTAANQHDLNQLKNLLHGDEEFISGDAGY